MVGRVRGDRAHGATNPKARVSAAHAVRREALQHPQPVPHPTLLTGVGMGAAWTADRWSGEIPYERLFRARRAPTAPIAGATRRASPALRWRHMGSRGWLGPLSNTSRSRAGRPRCHGWVPLRASYARSPPRIRLRGWAVDTHEPLLPVEGVIPRNTRSGPSVIAVPLPRIGRQARRPLDEFRDAAEMSGRAPRIRPYHPYARARTREGGGPGSPILSLTKAPLGPAPGSQ